MLRWVTVAEMSALWRVPQATIRRWIAQDRHRKDPWPQTPPGVRPTLYDGVAAEARYRSRKPARQESLRHAGRATLQVSGGEQ